MAKLLLVLVSIWPSRGISKSRRTSNFSVFVVKSDVDVSFILKLAGQARKHALFIILTPKGIIAKSSDSV